MLTPLMQQTLNDVGLLDDKWQHLQEQQWPIQQNGKSLLPPAQPKWSFFKLSPPQKWQNILALSSMNWELFNKDPP
eukprot:15345172-Ditylum_brightwellii.AAC.1